MKRDHYTILGVSPDASQADIKKAFRERALECHPDRAEEHEKVAAKNEFLRVQEAFDVLSDPDKRAAYDASGPGAGNGSSQTESSTPRTRSFSSEWRERRSGPVRVHRSILQNVNGLWAHREIVSDRTSVAMWTFAVLGFGLFLYEPHFIYATDVFLVDLALCTLLGGAHGYVLGSLWGYFDLIRDRSADDS